jgi:hypothetical protein
MPIHSDERDEAKAVRQKFLAHETIAKPNKADAEHAPPLPLGAGGGTEHAIAKALSGWSDADSQTSSSDEAKEGQGKAKVAGSNLQAGANLEMAALNVPFNALNPQAQSVVLQGGQPVQLLGANNRGNAALQTSAGSETGTTAEQGTDINWTTGNLPENLDSRVESYGIQTVVNPDGTIVVTSNNIQVSVQSLGPEFDAMFEGKSEAEINAMLDEWRARKDADDTLAYGGDGTEDLRTRAAEDDYYGSEQHVVWATAASARTGGRIPPEFFMEFDPFGGTAGNGPEIINPGDWAGGGAGGMLSTIAMGHDTDWNLGRYMNVGPLDELHDLEPTTQAQMKLMGTVGLMPAEAALPAAWDALPPETQQQLVDGATSGGPFGGLAGIVNGYGNSVEQLRNDPAYAPFLSAIDANASGAGFYSTGNPAWDVNYTWDYIAQNTNGEDWNATLARPMMDQYRFTPEQRDPNAPRRHDLDDLIQQHSPGHHPDDERETG